MCIRDSPAAFFFDLNKWGISVLGHKSFRDHHRYSPDDIAGLEEQAGVAGADTLLCTEKDVYDLPPEIAVRLPVFFCKIELQFNDEEQLWELILRMTENKKREETG